MRLARLSFNRSVLFYAGGISKYLFLEMLAALPNDAKIIGMGEDQTRATCHLFVTSSSFKEMGEIAIPNDIIAYFKREQDGSSRFEKLDMSEALV